MAADRCYRVLPRSPRALRQLDVLTKLIQQLAIKLRLTPRGRTDPKMVARALRKHQPSAYDRMRGQS
jgi:hypothetical protein